VIRRVQVHDEMGSRAAGSHDTNDANVSFLKHSKAFRIILGITRRTEFYKAVKFRSLPLVHATTRHWHVRCSILTQNFGLLALARRRRLEHASVSTVGSSSVTAVKPFERGFYGKENDYLIY